MRRFDLVEPTILEEACGLIANNDAAKVIAAGTALLTLVKHGIFVDLSKIKTAGGITFVHVLVRQALSATAQL
jgi:CO/xanthine dehydrogenase FAD-binding subunit